MLGILYSLEGTKLEAYFMFYIPIGSFYVPFTIMYQAKDHSDVDNLSP